MLKLLDHTAFKKAANLLIFGSMLCILFGEGTHLHSVFDHFSDHGDIHAGVHAHSSNEVQAESSFNGEKDHRHEVASADIDGVLAQSVKSRVELTRAFAVPPFPIDLVSHLNNQPSVFFNLPPPVKVASQYSSLSFSLRAPPLG